MQISQLQKRVLVLFIGLGLVVLWLPLSVLATNSLQNDMLEAPFNKYGEWSAQGHTFDLEVAHGWEKFFVPDGTYDNGDKLRYFRASALEFLFGSVEKRDGQDAQLFWSTEVYDAGIYQQVSGLTVGEYYGFQAGILQVYGNTTTKTHHKMFRSVGIDPYGGTDPTSSNVVWGPEEGLDADWFYPGVGVQAQSNTMTVFVRIRSIDEAPTYEENSVWVDDTFLDIAPTTTLTLTVDSPTQVTAAWSGTPRSGFHLFAYEAQYRQTTDSTWTDLQMFDSSTEPVPTDVSASFTVQPGVEYIVRARTWHEQDSGPHEVPGPWIEQSVTPGGLVYGHTLDNQGQNFAGVTVAVTGDPTKTGTSDGDGVYNLLTGAGTFGLTADHGSGWTTPQPVNVTVANQETIVPLTITLQPPDNVILNGDFESSAADWTVNGTAPTSITSGHYSGAASLCLSNTVTLSQTSLISDSHWPTLSFWYKLNGGDGNFTAEILGTEGLTATNSFSTSTTSGWQHISLPLNLTEVYTGSIGARFSLSQSGPSPAVVYLDQVSLGSSRTVSNVYLPIVLK